MDLDSMYLDWISYRLNTPFVNQEMLWKKWIRL